MVKKPFRGNYLELKVRVSYDKKTDSIHLTSKDKDLDAPRGFHLALNGGRDAEQVLRSLLEQEGLIPKERFKTIRSHASFYDSKRHGKWNEFPLGVYANDEETIWDPTRSPHVFLAGGSGSGKSVIQRNMIFHCVQHSDRWHVLGIDLKRVELTPYAKYEKSVMVATSLEEAGETVDFAHETMMKRYQEMTEVGVSNYQDLENTPKAILVMIDEAFIVLSPTGITTPKGKEDDAFKKELHGKLLEISRLGRAAGVHLVIATQRINADFLYGEFKQNLSTRIAAGRMDVEPSRSFLDNDAATKLPGIKGRGYFQEFGEGSDFQGYFADMDWPENNGLV